MPRQLLIYGSSGHARVIAAAAQLSGYRVVGWADDDAGRRGHRVADYEVLGIGVREVLQLLQIHRSDVIVGVGDNRARARIYNELFRHGASFASVIHPAAHVAVSAHVGCGVAIMAGAIVQADAKIGDNVIVNTGATVDHDCRIHDHAHLSPGCNLGGNTQIGVGAHVGIGAAIIQGLSVGSWSIVGAGAAVVTDLPSNITAVGVPARVRKGIET